MNRHARDEAREAGTHTYVSTGSLTAAAVTVMLTVLFWRWRRRRSTN